MIRCIVKVSDDYLSSIKSMKRCTVIAPGMVCRGDGHLILKTFSGRSEYTALILGILYTPFNELDELDAIEHGYSLDELKTYLTSENLSLRDDDLISIVYLKHDIDPFPLDLDISEKEIEKSYLAYVEEKTGATLEVGVSCAN